MIVWSPPSASEMLDALGLRGDGGKALRDVAERQGEIAEIGERQRRRVDPASGMGAVDQHAAGLADGLRAEAGAAAVGRAEIEGNARHAEIGIAIGPRDAEEGGGEGQRSGWGTSPALCKKETPGAGVRPPSECRRL